MGIEFKARVLLELGAELISSDAVALYELIKNAIDAASPSVKIAISITLQHSAYVEIKTKLAATPLSAYSTEKFLSYLEQRIEPDAPSTSKEKFYAAFGEPVTRDDAIQALELAYFAGNLIRISDSGDGMNPATIQKGYLTVGTPMRLLQKQLSSKPVWTAPNTAGSAALGEKGIGRLAAMRLGHYVKLRTATAAEASWNKLELDWRPIFADPSLDASALDYKPEPGRVKSKASEKGTTLFIRDLQSDWTEQKLQSLAATELVKLSDPFDSDLILDLLSIKLQGKDVLIPEFDIAKLKHADAICRAKFSRVKGWNSEDPLDGLELAIEVDYRHYKASKTWHLSSENLASCIKEPVGRRRKAKVSALLPDSDAIVAALPSLGPFEMEFHWFNRGRLQQKESDIWRDINTFVKNWSGGLLVYRDGYRVYPYGSGTDDWLDLDRSALSGSAYKLNRAQIIGYLRISQQGNPSLHDQTNREGFRDCPEKEALRRLLRHVIITKCKIFLEDTQKENEIGDPESMDKLETRVDTSELAAVAQLRQLQTRVPEESESINEVLFQIGEIRDAWERAKATIKLQEADLEKYIHLAGVGLEVEFIAHELARITDNTLRALKSDGVLNEEATRKGLEVQLKTIEKRIRVLDLMSVPGRQRKTVLDVNEVVTLLIEMHEVKIERHNLNVKFICDPTRPLRAKVEQGQILQILDNLFSNSFYWLEARFDRSTPAEIIIRIDSVARMLTFTDNGPGVTSDMVEDIFKPFVTNKPPGEGRGLGLYISKRLAEYNQLVLGMAPANTEGVHHTFTLSFANAPTK